MTSNQEARHFDTMTTAAAPEGDNTRSRQEQEEKLILTAWQNMSSALQQHSLCECSTAPGPAQSFLSKQRQSTQARRALSPRLQPR
ncbi:protein Hook homolog 3-like [Acanthopagrus latus]|uniref:protein Hook homolog 3-like n=1 Tax=Acanthopagrus latus TaxID=8177 RepID=UPI00187C8351|nr:protein Hook homolog 3-like [Acanthopagrus latus]XP_036959431.1 protein Hook homolog 3-like [Acanthopagrus latus]XP_036959440.1 protein Hook homolog 3-like [Acanthopagrus latus]